MIKGFDAPMKCSRVSLLTVAALSLAVASCGKSSVSTTSSAAPTTAVATTAPATVPTTTAAPTTTEPAAPATTTATTSASTTAAPTTAAPSTTAAPVPLRVTAVTVSGSPSSACWGIEQTFTFTATLKFPPDHAAGTVTYQWLRSDGATTDPITIAITAGQLLKKLTTTWTFTAYSSETVGYRVKVTAPNSKTSAQGNVTLNDCVN